MQRTISLFAKSGYIKEISCLKKMLEEHSHIISFTSSAINNIEKKYIEQIERNKFLEKEIETFKYDNKMLEQKIKFYLEKK